MDSEESIVARLEKLRQWQVEQQARLLKQQEEQMQLLYYEQDRMYQSLSLSFQNLSQDGNSVNSPIISGQRSVLQPQLKSKETLVCYMDSISEQPNIPTQQSPCTKYIKSTRDIASELLNSSSVEKITSNSAISIQIPQKDSDLNDSRNITNSYSKIELLDEVMDGVKRLNFEDPNQNTLDDTSDSTSTAKALSRKNIDLSLSKNHITIDDIPVPSSKEDFQSLLEKKLKIYDTTDTEKVLASKPKRPFLKKGEGLARYKLSQPVKPINQNIKNHCQSQSSKKYTISKDNKNSFTNNKPKTVKTMNIKKNLPSLKVAQPKLCLRNISGINKITDAVEKTGYSVASPAHELNSSDIETKSQREMEEVRIFELLEEKAENSSFCSTSSAVVAFLRQSSPFKINVNNKNQSGKSSSRNNEHIYDRVLQITNDYHGRQNSSSNVNSRWETISVREELIKRTDDDSSRLCETMSDLKTKSDVKSCAITNYDDSHESNSSDKDVSVHVRFAEVNEYKTYDLTDDSQSDVSKCTYGDERAWSDYSQITDSSEDEAPTNHLCGDKLSICEQVDDVCSIKRDTDGIVILDTDKDKKHDIYRNNDEASDDDELVELESLHLDDDQDCEIESCTNKKEIDEEVEDKRVFFKSELLKNRLLELEREIDIFRKENAALALQKEKIQEEYKRLTKELKDKEKALDERQKRIEENHQEEKKKLAREKSALESRIRDSVERNQRDKLKRQETQALKDELDELKREMTERENKWSVMQARQRSQMRILKSENAELKEEIEKLRNSKKTTSKTKLKNRSNTKAIHRINKQLNDYVKTTSKKKSLSDEEEELIETMLKASFPSTETNMVTEKLSDDNSSDNETSSAGNDQMKSQAYLETISKKRELYKSLIEEATENYVSNHNSVDNVRVTFKECNPELKNHSLEQISEELSNPDRNYIREIGNSSSEKISEKLINPNQDENLKFTQTDNNERFNSHNRSLKDVDNLKEHKMKRKIVMNMDDENVKQVKHPDGLIEYWYPNGNVRKIYPEEDLVKMIYYNGDVCETTRDGKVKYFYASTRTWHTTMPNGLEILEFSDGQVEKRMQNGTIEVSFPDGSSKIIMPDGLEKWTLPDGTLAETLPNGEKILTMPNGQREIHTDSHKRREYPDGTVKLVYTDGTQETRYSNGRIRLKDKDGNLLMDSYNS